MTCSVDEIEVDTFAGGGGASLGMARALGRPPFAAINHDSAAIAMHAANHPGTRHYTEDVWRVAPRAVTGGRSVGLLWASPDCKHFSRAKGAKPVSKNIRSLAWVVVRWAVECRPRVIILENVREFQDWGPLVPVWRCRRCGWGGTEGQATLGRHGRRRCPRCDAAGLAQTADQVPDPARKGLTFRRFTGRLRGLGYRVECRVLDAADYGAPTHRRRLFLVARCDGRPVAWPEPTHGDPRRLGEGLFSRGLRPWRTAAECIDWGLPCPSIFLSREEGRKVGALRPLAEKTMQRIARGVKRYVLDNPAPFLIRYNTETGPGDNHAHPLTEPLPTVVTQPRFGLIAPVLVQTGYGERPGQAARTLDLQAPMGTVVASGCKQALVAVWLAKHFGGVVGQAADVPLGTVTARDHHGLVAANLVHMNHGEKQWSACDEPMRTVTGGNHAALVYSFLTKYYGTAVGQALDVPLGTVTGTDRFGVVTVTVAGEPYALADVGIRMLRPRELARGNGFPDSYVLTGTATAQVSMIGNSVPPDIAEALVRANYTPDRLEVAS